ncbi:hypothetical protein BO99DRAFT_412033 [Aspergillus violaceofuscus CBS 115571]|uniref:Uncharacterized protein n=1 Tax=Aspergillus violaceofuscus (strain CBS 115571) TaxID=1450538 RepID=A0A2V5HCG4_ASPV1|nr:hypothetical protein BO99DRAFT_412033 [Aspergillus violaceofuscus CBS 115571]
MATIASRPTVGIVGSSASLVLVLLSHVFYRPASHQSIISTEHHACDLFAVQSKKISGVAEQESWVFLSVCRPLLIKRRGNHCTAFCGKEGGALWTEWGQPRDIRDNNLVMGFACSQDSPKDLVLPELQQPDFYSCIEVLISRLAVMPRSVVIRIRCTNTEGQFLTQKQRIKQPKAPRVPRLGGA